MDNFAQLSITKITLNKFRISRKSCSNAVQIFFNFIYDFVNTCKYHWMSLDDLYSL